MALKKNKSKNNEPKSKAKQKKKEKAKSKPKTSQYQHNYQSVNVNVNSTTSQPKKRAPNKNKTSSNNPSNNPSLPPNWIFNTHGSQTRDNDAIQNELKDIKNFITNGMLTNNKPGFNNEQNNIGFGNNGISYDNRVRILPSEFTNIGYNEPISMFDEDEFEHSSKVNNLLNKRATPIKATSKQASNKGDIFFEDEKSYKGISNSKNLIFGSNNSVSSNSSVVDIPVGTYCSICNQHISRPQDMGRHVNSQKHQKNIVKYKNRNK